MLSLLLDEQISPQVAVAVSARQMAVPIVSIYHWRGGALTGTDDDLILQAAAEDRLTLVTYDRKTIPPLLVDWGASGKSHAGVIFVDDCSITPADFGSLAYALVFCWETQGEWDWTDRVIYLCAAHPSASRQS